VSRATIHGRNVSVNFFGFFVRFLSMIFLLSFNFYPSEFIIYAFLKIDKRCRSQELFHKARLIGITRGRFAIRLDPFGMLDPEVVVNLLPEFGD
jgi:hypothetical protein